MKNENQQMELARTHAAGFGGSDAQLVLDIAERIENGQPLTMTQRHRLRVIKGLELPTSSPDNDAILAGHAFEEEVAKTLPEEWRREVLLLGEANFINFRAFAHADFYNGDTETVKECKWSRKFDVDGLKKQYAAQLQWYMTVCGVKSVSLVYDTESGQGVVDIADDPKLGAKLMQALHTIDTAWADLDVEITEKDVTEVDERGARLLGKVKDLTDKAAYLEEQLKAAKEELQEYFETEKLTKLSADWGAVSYTAPTTAKTFDSKKFESEYPDLYANYLKDSKRKASLRVTIKKGGDQ